MVKGTFTFRLADDIREGIEEIAAGRNQSAGSLIELILREWLTANADKRRPKPRK